MAMSKKTQQTLILVLMGGAFGLYAYYNYLWKPTNEKIAQLTQKRDEILEKVESLKRTAQRLDVLEKQTEELSVEVAQSEKKLPPKKSLDEILRLVTEEALRNRVTILNFTPGADKPESYFIEIPIAMNVSGQFHAVGRFLAAIGLQERIMSARGLTLNAVAASKKGNTVTGMFTLLAYTFKG